MKLIKCTNCGEVFEEAVSPCKICGGVIELTISLTGIGAESSAGILGSVSETNRNNCKHIKYNAPSGAKSESSLSNSQLTGFVKSPIDIGRQGENRVATCIKNHLTKIGKPYHDAESHDDRGEDCALIIDNENVFIQIVTMKPSDGYWKSVAQGSGDIKLNLNEVASAIKSTISQKALRYQNRVNATNNMLLAIDIGHFGTLATNEFAKIYLDNYKDPAIEYNFGAVWLIGPTENNILRLGSSRW